MSGLPAGELTGRVIAITGSTGGLGRALALDVARAGAELVLLGRNVLKLQGLHAEIEQFAPGRALMAPLDLEKAPANDYDGLAAALLSRHGRLDGLVHCAGLLGTLTPIDHYEVPTWARVMHVKRHRRLRPDAGAAARLAPVTRCLSDLHFQQRGSQGPRILGRLRVSKFGVEGLMQVLADELSGNTNIRVNSINPGAMRTLMRRQAYPSEAPDAPARPETLTGPYLRLLGPAGAGITGQALDCQ